MLNVDTATKNDILTEVMFNPEFEKFCGGCARAEQMTESELRQMGRAFILQAPDA